MNQLGIIFCGSFALFTAGYLFAIQWMALRQSGWERLSSRYPSFEASNHSLEKFTDATVRVNAHWYSQVASIGLGAAGLRIEVHAPILKLRHKPMLIPWDDITPAGSPDEGMLLLQIGESATVTLTESSANGAQQWMQRQTMRFQRVRARK
jgi:hypothetical protein